MPSPETLQPPEHDASWTGETNYGTQAWLYVGFYTVVYRTAIKFSKLSDGTIPSTSTVTSAVFSLNAYDDDAAGSFTHYVYRNTSDFNEATVKSSNAPSYDGTELGSRAFGTTDRGWCNFTLSATEITKIVNGTYPNYGFTLKCAQEGVNSIFRFRSSEYVTDTSLCPKLVITYTEGGSSTTVQFYRNRRGMESARPTRFFYCWNGLYYLGKNYSGV